MFLTYYSRFEGGVIHEKSNSGNSKRPNYYLGVDDNGRQKLFISGEIDIQDEINSFRDSCDISLIIKRLANGEISSVIDPNKCFDTTLQPKDYVDVFKRVNEMRDFVSKLPLELQKEFNQNPLAFLKKIESSYISQQVGSKESLDSSQKSSVSSDSSADQEGGAAVES